jgi:hypothetical protein
MKYTKFINKNKNKILVISLISVIFISLAIYIFRPDLFNLKEKFSQVQDQVEKVQVQVQDLVKDLVQIPKDPTKDPAKDHIQDPTQDPTIQSIRICICMSATPNIYSYSKLSEYINRKYAEKHGYTFVMFYDTMTDRAPQWCKIQVLNKLLDTDMYDYIFWIDADAFFNNFDIGIQKIISDSKKDLIICDDIANSGRKDTLNSGTFIVKTTDWSKDFFKKLWSYKGPYLYKYFHEQTMMEQYLDKDHMDVRPAKEFNTEIGVQLKNNTLKDNYVIHLMAMTADFRVKYMSEWIKNHKDILEPDLKDTRKDLKDPKLGPKDLKIGPKSDPKDLKK